MADKMLIDASHEEETRVVVVRGNRIEEFDFESQHKKQLRGNIYLAKVTRVEPSLQAAFVDYGGNRHGFLAFSEIHPDYYQIPLADRQALLRAEAEEHRRADRDERDEDDSVEAGVIEIKEDDAPVSIEDGVELNSEEATLVEAAEEAPAKPKKPRRSRARAKKADADAPVAEIAEGSDDESDGGVMAAEVDADSISEEADLGRGRDSDDDDDDDNHHEKEVIESVGAEDAMEEVPDRVARKPRKQYRIQEVIKRRQILLVQVAKEERGNKGAALTTYLSLAGRYSVLMPNTARGGGISRKITNPQDRKRLKEVARSLDVPLGMGVILRTAGANRTKVEIKRDFEYLMRLWENVRTLTLNSTAPCLVYEEGSLIKRSIRDLYNKDISEVIVAGEEGYREAKDFMKMLMPSHAKVVQPYRDIHPIFSRSGIEAQLDRMLQPQVTLKSGGYLIINQTEALVAIDVNSGRSTREHSIEDTALQTNLEAAEEVARQLRLRDLAGLIVIDFIDMEEKRNNRSVEKKLKDCLKNDRARIQVGRISHFGLLEMSRQRIRASVLESTTQICSHCGGTGHVRSQSSVALHVLRGIEEYLLKNTTHDILVRSTPETALYLLNHKRSTIVDYENRFGVSILIETDDGIGSQHFAIDKGEPVENPVKIESLLQSITIVEEEDEYVPEEIDEEEDEATVPAATARASSEEAAAGDDQQGRKRKRRRRRRNRNGQPNGEAQDAARGEDDEEDDDDAEEGDADETSGDAVGETDAVAAEKDENQKRKRRRRGKRGGRRNRFGEEGDATSEASGDAEGEDGETAGDADGADVVEVVAVTEAEIVETVADVAAEPETAQEAIESATSEVPAPKARRSRKAKVVASPVEEPIIETVAEAAIEASLEEAAPDVAAEAAVEGVTEIAPVEVAAPEAPVEETKASRGNRGENIASSAPVVVSNRPEGEDGDDPNKPKKAGWWQRRGFL